MEIEKVLDKLRKLQRLYNSATKINNEGEAAAAAEMIQRLLIKYNLTMEEVGTDEQKKSANEIKECTVSGFTHTSIGGAWEYRLWDCLCKHNFCRCYMYGNSYKRLILLGNSENIEVVKWMFDMLSERFVHFSSEQFKKYKETDEYIFAVRKCSKDRYQRGYLIGAVDGLNRKLTEIAERNKKQEPELSAKITALTIRNDGAITDYVHDKWGGVRTVKTNFTAGIRDSRERGYHDGYNTDINKPIQENHKRATSTIKLLG